MSRRDFDSDDDSKGTADRFAMLPCSNPNCGTATPRATLAQYGARCFPCYEAYRREPQPRIYVGDKREDPKSWAYALKAREEAGERLSPPQRDMWRQALRWLKVESDKRGPELE